MRIIYGSLKLFLVGFDGVRYTLLMFNEKMAMLEVWLGCVCVAHDMEQANLR